LKSQIREKGMYKSLCTKLFLVKGNIVTEIIDKDSRIISKDQINRKSRVDIILNFDKLWVNKNNIAYYKWKILYIKKIS
jgi:hypothetical protein